jgi:hypothetical protein
MMRDRARMIVPVVSRPPAQFHGRMAIVTGGLSWPLTRKTTGTVSPGVTPEGTIAFNW